MNEYPHANMRVNADNTWLRSNETTGKWSTASSGDNGGVNIIRYKWNYDFEINKKISIKPLIMEKNFLPLSAPQMHKCNITAFEQDVFP